MKHGFRKTPAIIFIVFIFAIVFFTLARNNKIVNKSAFPKGVLALNTDRAVYLTNETVTIQIAALDQTGTPLCNSKLVLEIQGKKQPTLQQSPVCSQNSATNNPDYFYQYQPPKTGQYRLKLTNTETGLSVTNNFSVVPQRTLDIKRETATRINPQKNNRVPVKLIITASQNYQGTVSDSLPSGFSIPWQGPATIKDNQITWQVDLKAGQTKELIYEYKPSNTIPALYHFGQDHDWQVVSAN